jgi:hypothetical protein
MQDDKNGVEIFLRTYTNSRAGRTRQRWFDADEEQRYSEALSGRETMVYKGETDWNYMGGGGSVQRIKWAGITRKVKVLHGWLCLSAGEVNAKSFGCSQ